MPEDQQWPGEPDSLDVELRWRELPDHVSEAREAAAQKYDRDSEILEPRIEAHLQASGLAIDALDRLHTLIADRTDLDLQGDSRQAAAWVIAGRCIGLARAMLALLRDGYAAEAIPTARGLHEATRLLDAVAEDEEVELLRRWLADDDWVRPRETRVARERMRDRLERMLREQQEVALQAGDTDHAELIADQLRQPGLVQPGAMSTASRSIYDTLSRIGHTRRSGTSDALAVGPREMATGPHPNPWIRADYAMWATLVIEEVLMSVGHVLSRFVGPGYFEDQLRPLIEALAEVRRAHPLEP